MRHILAIASYIYLPPPLSGLLGHLLISTIRIVSCRFARALAVVALCFSGTNAASQSKGQPCAPTYSFDLHSVDFDFENDLWFTDLRITVLCCADGPRKFIVPLPFDAWLPHQGIEKEPSSTLDSVVIGPLASDRRYSKLEVDRREGSTRIKLNMRRVCLPLAPTNESPIGQAGIMAFRRAVELVAQQRQRAMSPEPGVPLAKLTSVVVRYDWIARTSPESKLLADVSFGRSITLAADEETPDVIVYFDRAPSVAIFAVLLLAFVVLGAVTWLRPIHSQVWRAAFLSSWCVAVAVSSLTLFDVLFSSDTRRNSTTIAILGAAVGTLILLTVRDAAALLRGRREGRRGPADRTVANDAAALKVSARKEAIHAREETATSTPDARVQRLIQVVICSTEEDKDKVRELRTKLMSDGVNPWVVEDVLPGAERDLVIRRVVADADIVLMCLSPSAVTSTSHFQVQLRVALGAAESRPRDEVFIIPVQLEECDIPESLQRWEPVSMLRATDYDRLLRSLHSKAEMSG